MRGVGLVTSKWPQLSPFNVLQIQGQIMAQSLGCPKLRHGHRTLSTRPVHAVLDFFGFSLYPSSGFIHSA